MTRLALIGSRARAENRADSDVDVLIDVDPQVRFSILDLVGVAHEIEDRTGLPANIHLRRSLRPDIAKSVHDEAVEVF